MDLPSRPSGVQSAAYTMVSNLADGIVDSRFFATKKISVLLDDNNYLLWRQQILLALKTHRLQHFLDLSTTAPPQQVMDQSGVPQENPEFARFEQQDCALASWLLSSVSPGVLPHLIGMDSSAQIWNAIVTLYGSKTTSRLMSYRRALHAQRKGDLSMKDFLVKIKTYCDSLASCGEIISDHEHITAILNGLPPEYESVITIVTSSQVPYTLQGVTTILLDAETRQQVIVCEVPSSANLVSSQVPNVVNENVSTPDYRPSSNNRGRGRGRSYGSRVQCQLCGKTGHLVDRCYHRFDASYKSIGYRPSSAPQANLSMFGAGYPTPFWVGPTPAVNPNVSPGWYCPPTQISNWSNPFLPASPQHGNVSQVSASTPTLQSQAFLTTPGTVADNAWYPDSGATHHLTNSGASISETIPYNGPVPST